MKQMWQLESGNRVQVDSELYSDIYMFSHRLADTKSLFVQLTTVNTTLLLTAGHYLYVNGELDMASTVQIGDKLTAADGSMLAVTHIGQVWGHGLYNPHTLQGDIVVNGVRTSTYTEALNPTLAHTALWPVRMLYQAGVDVVGNMLDHGAPELEAAKYHVASALGILPENADKMAARKAVHTRSVDSADTVAWQKPPH